MGEVVEPTFRSSVTRLVGDEARAWLAGLPALEAEIAARWELELGHELPGGLLASVRAVRRADGTDAVLKLAGPWDRTADEIACLRAGAAARRRRCSRPTRSAGAILLERITPGDARDRCRPGAVASLLAAIHVAGRARAPRPRRHS